MPRICSIHQPSFWPYLGLFDKIARSDVFVFLDDVQFVKNEFKNRNRLFVHSIKSAQRSEADWLTLPVRQESMLQSIRATRLVQTPQTIRKHLALLSQAYARSSPAFSKVWPAVEELYRQHEREEVSLAEINEAMTRLALRWLGVTTEIFGASSKIAGKSDEPTQRLIDICKHMGADAYLAGAGSRSYLQAARFAEQGIRLLWQEWRPTPYPQAHSPETFVPYLSCLDLLFNHGSDSQRYCKTHDYVHSLQD